MELRKKTYRKGEYLFIQIKDNRSIVIPERIFENEEEAEKFFNFIKEQILKSKWLL
ncbi:YcxB family protein [Escherichia coli]|uniref:YcxB family protein n=1 Tax=Escherichia coli TaxID=562 RepID=UPI0035C86FD8